MSKKHYIAVAAEISSMRMHNPVDPDVAEGWHAAVSSFAIRMADLFAADNPRFDRGRFLLATSTEVAA